MPKDKNVLPQQTSPAKPTPPPGYQLNSLPTFIQPANANTKIVSAPSKQALGGGQIVADVDKANPQTIVVREPSLYTPQVHTHESTHVYQFSRNPAFVENSLLATSTSGKSFDSIAGYGEVAGLEHALNNHKTIADFNIEQQAQMISDYQRLTADALKRQDAKSLSRVTAAYHPFISQLAKIPPKGADMTKMTKEDLTPAAPGLPPPTVIGVPMAPDPLIGGQPSSSARYTPSQLKALASQRNSTATGPTIGQTKQFTNGRTGVWDGHGWKAQ